MHIHVHTCMHACIHTHIRTYRYTCTHAHTHDFDAIRCTLLHARIRVMHSCLPARVTCVHMAVIGTMCGHACMHCKYGYQQVCLESPRMSYVYYARLGIHNGCGLALHVRVNKVSSHDMCVCVCVCVCLCLCVHESTYRCTRERMSDRCSLAVGFVGSLHGRMCASTWMCSRVHACMCART